MLSPTHMGMAVHRALYFLRKNEPPSHDLVRRYMTPALARHPNIPKWQWRRIYYAWDYLADLVSLADEWSFEKAVFRTEGADLIMLRDQYVYVVEVKVITMPIIDESHFQQKNETGLRQVRTTMNHLKHFNRRFIIEGYIVYLTLTEQDPPDALWVEVEG